MNLFVTSVTVTCVLGRNKLANDNVFNDQRNLHYLYYRLYIQHNYHISNSSPSYKPEEFARPAAVESELRVGNVNASRRDAVV